MYSDGFELKTRINRISSLKGCLEYSKYSKSPLTIYNFNALVGFQIISLLPKNLLNLMGQPCTLHSSQFLQTSQHLSWVILLEDTPACNVSRMFILRGESGGYEVLVAWDYRLSKVGISAPLLPPVQEAQFIPKYWLRVILFLKQIWKKRRVFNKIS